MPPLRSRLWLAAGATLGVAAVAALAISGGGESEPAPEAVPIAEPALEAGSDPKPGAGDERDPASRPERDREHDHGDDHPEDPAQAPDRLDEDELGADERRAAGTVRRYVDALDARDAAAVCRLLVDGAIDAVDLPRRRGGCAASLGASIGYRDPRGLPVWESASVQGLLTVALDGDRASVTATTLTRFADRDEPSIEDDVVHLVRDGESWRIAKASSTLYRSVGIDNVPPRVLAAP